MPPTQVRGRLLKPAEGRGGEGVHHQQCQRSRIELDRWREQEPRKAGEEAADDPRARRTSAGLVPARFVSSESSTTARIATPIRAGGGTCRGQR